MTVLKGRWVPSRRRAWRQKCWHKNSVAYHYGNPILSRFCWIYLFHLAQTILTIHFTTFIMFIPILYIKLGNVNNVIQDLGLGLRCSYSWLEDFLFRCFVGIPYKDLRLVWQYSHFLVWWLCRQQPHNNITKCSKFDFVLFGSA